MVSQKRQLRSTGPVKEQAAPQPEPEDLNADDESALSILNSASRNKEPTRKSLGVFKVLKRRYWSGSQKSDSNEAKVVDWEVPTDEPSTPRLTKRRKVRQPILEPRISTGQTPQVIIPSPIKRPRSKRGKFTEAPASNVTGGERRSAEDDPPQIEHSSLENPELLDDTPSREASKEVEQVQGARRSKQIPSTKQPIQRRNYTPPAVASVTKVGSAKVNGIKKRTKSSTRKNMQLAALPTHLTPSADAGGTSNILDNPNPVKAIGSAAGSSASRASSDRLLASVRANGGIEELSTNEGVMDEAAIIIRDPSARMPDRSHSNPPTTSELYTISLDFNHLDDLITIAKQVGSRYSKNSKKFNVIITVKAAKTNSAKKIIRHIQHLQFCYESLANINPTSDPAQAVARENISTALNRLKENVGRLKETKFEDKMLGNVGAGKDFIKLLLIDLYFIVLPKWLECIKLGMKVYNEGSAKANTMRMASVAEMYSLLECYTDLASSATAQSVQPTCTDIRGKGSNTHNLDFRVMQPTKTVMRNMNELRKKFRRKLVAIKNKAMNQSTQTLQPEGQHTNDVEWEKNQRQADAHRIEQENHRRAENHKHELEKQKRIAYIHQRQRQDFLKIKREAAEEDALFKRRFCKLPQFPEAARYVVENGTTKNTEDWDDDDPFADDYERVHVFPEHSKRQLVPKKPWSDEETLGFIFCMMEGGDDKFGRAAEKLACSMEEVFTAAKDLQEANDRAHERGELNAPEDSWTYKVWPGT